MSAPFHSCPDCGAVDDWCEAGECVECGYDVFENSVTECQQCGVEVEGGPTYCGDCGAEL